MASQDRAELLKNAIVFLNDPKSQSSPLAQRIQFLESKGLTPAEIEHAISQSNSMRQTSAVSAPPQYQPTYQYGPSPYPMHPPPAHQPLDWRDYFIMAVVSGSFMFGAVSLARKYIMPHLRPPTSTAYEADRDALTEQFDAAETLLKEIQAETASVRQAVEDQRIKVEQTTQEVEACVKEMREGETRTRDEMREIREEITQIRDMLPKMIEKNKESQTQSLAELQQELKSLKALLMSRGPSFQSPAPSPSLPSLLGRPTIPAWQLADTSSKPVSNGVINGVPSSASTESTASGSTETTP